VEKVREVREEREAEDAVRDLEDRRGAAGRSGKRAREERVAVQEPAQRVVLEEMDHPFRRREEVQAARGGGRVEDDQVVLRVVRVLEERLDPHVLEDAGQRVHEACVELVLLDAREDVRRRDAREQPLEHGLGVDLEHAEGRARGQARDLHVHGLVDGALGDAQRLREPSRGVHGHHEDAPAALGRREPGRGRESRLAHAAGSHEDEELGGVEPGAGVERRGQTERLAPLERPADLPPPSESSSVSSSRNAFGSGSGSSGSRIVGCERRGSDSVAPLRPHGSPPRGPS
jgi:hypothetical protein